MHTDHPTYAFVLNPLSFAKFPHPAVADEQQLRTTSL